MFWYSCVDNSYQDKEGILAYLFYSLSKTFISQLLLKKVLLNSEATFELFAIELSSIVFISSTKTLTKREAAILKVGAPGIITARKVIIAILKQSERSHLHNHLSN